METPYACYLCLPDLLALQQPRTPAEQPAQWADERFFIAVHQSAEVLAGQALVDLNRAVEQAHEGQDPEAAAALRRVTAVVEVLEHHLALLDHLEADRFASFRPLLGNASAAQSHQLTELFGRTTAPNALRPADASQTQGAQTTDALRALRAAVIRWQTRHLLLVERMIGDRPGTGGTSGLAHLRARIDLPPHD
ncbi:tryptophan 2,3-dioxygenase family protein [Streptomyces sp. NPDC052693]|uniref:tryptophan 2,3-dioxygenase family protein n=1 Tax=Streptomyces sp. NPDC052693 TaxID=3155814 RepID=UPI00341769AC